MFGGFGILAGNTRQWACIPLSIRFHDCFHQWKGAAVSCTFHIIQIVEDAYRAAEIFGNALFLLNRYFLSVPALRKLTSLNREGSVRMEIVTKAKDPVPCLNGLTLEDRAGSIDQKRGRYP